MADQPEEESKLVLTRDGSHTVYSSRFDQHYHNPNGAVAESRYVFFEQTGLPDGLTTRDQLSILDIGFGTGLSLMLTLDYYIDRHSSAKIDYHSVEGFPLSSKIVQKFNYGEHLYHPEVAHKVTEVFDNLSKGINRFELAGNVSLHLYYGMFEDYNPGKINANYIFHDAFSPDVNPALWTGEVFRKIYNLSAEDVILSTYSAASKAQGALAWAGWNVAKTQGALGKREMLLAATDPGRLDDLERIDEERFARRYEEGDF